MFTVDPATGDERRIVIEGCVRARRGRRRRPGRTRHLRRDQAGPDASSTFGSATQTHRRSSAVPTDGDRATSTSTDVARAVRCSTDDEVARPRPSSACASRSTTATPQDIEWAIADGEDAISCSRARSRRCARRATDAGRGSGAQVLLARARRLPGMASGPVRVLQSPERGRPARGRRGPRRADDEPRLGARDPREAAALVTDGGGMTCHAGDRQPRARRAVRRRHAQGDDGAARRHELVTVDGHERRWSTRATSRRRSTAAAVAASRSEARDRRRSREALATRRVRQPCDRRPGRAGRGAARRRRRAAARRVHAHRRARRRAPAQLLARGSRPRARRPDGRVAAAHHARLRAAAGRVSHDRLPQQRVPRPRRRRPSSSRSRTTR